MYLFIPIIILLTWLIAFISPIAASSPRRYYDWSSTLEVKQPPVLGVVYAQEATGAAVAQSTPLSPESYQQFNKYLFGANLTPANPFYFIKIFQETLQLAITPTHKEKGSLKIAIAGERLAELKQLADSNNARPVAVAAIGYEQAIKSVADNLEDLKNRNQEISDLVKMVELETAKHNVVLEIIAVKVPNQLKNAAEKALEASWKGIDITADLSLRPAVPPDVVNRIQALQAQGLITEGEANKLLNVKTRQEARLELIKYTNEGLFPEADFIKLNENVKFFYPQEFFKIHEVKRFYELKKLESEKPDDITLVKIQEFAKTYKPGDVVPADIRKYWVPVVRLEELQNTLRIDLIDEELIKPKEEDYKKFTEIVERFKPRPEDIVYITNYIQKYKVAVAFLPPEYQRMYNIGKRFGAQCGVGLTWISSLALPSGGLCASLENAADLKVVELAPQNKKCEEAVIPAKGPGGICTAFPTNCIPEGWSKVSTCTLFPPKEANIKPIECLPNTHFIPITYMPNGGYCIPNYTAVKRSPDESASFCTVGYHRSYQGGPCLPDYNPSGSPTSLPPIIATPGNYPNPVYPTFGQCGLGAHWVSGLFDPKGGYCVSDSCSPPANGCGSNNFYDYKACTCRQCSPGRSFSGVTCENDPGSNIPITQSIGAYDCPTRNCGGGANFFDPASCSCRACSPGRVFNGLFCENLPGTTSSSASSGPYDCGTTKPCGGGANYFDVATCSCRQCPAGQEFSGVACSYVPQPAPGTIFCPQGQYYTEYKTCAPYKQTYSTSQCPVIASCIGNTSWDPNSCVCKQNPSGFVPSPTPIPQKPAAGCPYQTIWNGYACVWDSGPTTTPAPPPRCPEGSTFNGIICIRNDGGGIMSCPIGTGWTGRECTVSSSGSSYIPPTVPPGASCYPPEVMCSSGVGCCLYPTAIPQLQPTSPPPTAVPATPVPPTSVPPTTAPEPTSAPTSAP